MTSSEKDYLFEVMEDIREETHENNIMLRQIIHVINIYIAHHDKENEEDFGRNVLANLLSGMLDISHFAKR